MLKLTISFYLSVFAVLVFTLSIFTGAAPIAFADYGDAPANLRVTVKSPYSALLEWDEAPQQEDDARYLLFRNGASLGVKKGQSFLDNALLPEREFTYSLAAVSSKGSCFNTQEITFSTLAKGLDKVAAPSVSAGPTTPANLRILRNSSDTLVLSWDKGVGDELKFSVTRNGEVLDTVREIRSLI